MEYKLEIPDSWDRISSNDSNSPPPMLRRDIEKTDADLDESSIDESRLSPSTFGNEQWDFSSQH